MQRAIQDTYPEDFSHCFGCGRYNEQGYQIKTYLDGATTVTRYRPAPYHLSAGEFAYGGILASVVDCHSAGSAAIFWMQDNRQIVGAEPSPRFVTARLEIDYVKPTPLTDLTLIGTAEEIGKRKAIVTTELLAGDVVTVRGRGVMVRVGQF